MAHLSTKSLLKEIQSEDLETVYINITHKAEEWIVAGFVAEANQLLEILWSYDIKHSRHLWVPDQGFQVMWEVSGRRPSNVPFALTSLEDIERLNRQEVIHGVGIFPGMDNYLEKPIEELTGSQLLAKAIHSAYEGTEPIPVLLSALERYLTTGDAAGHSFFCATTLASFLAAHSGLNQEAEKFIRLWGQGFLKWPYNYSLEYLMRDRVTAWYLLQGVLAREFSLTHEEIQKDIELITTALAERMQKGRTLPYGHLSWRELLQTISGMAIEQNTNQFTEETVAANWLGREGSQPEDIQNAEDALGISLPEDYKEFLLVSNGFDSITVVGATLAPINYVNYLVNCDSAFVEDWISTVWSDDASTADRFRQCIVIGGFEEEQQVLLVPDESHGWECWFFAAWTPGETRYPSFRYYMENQLQDLEERRFAE